MSGSRWDAASTKPFWPPMGSAGLHSLRPPVPSGLPVDEHGHVLHDYEFMLLPPCGFVNHVQHVALAYRSPLHDGASFQCVAILHEGAVQALTVRPIRRY